MKVVIIVLIVAVIGGVIAFFASDGNKRLSDAFAGAGASALGCLFLIARLALYVFFIFLAIKFVLWLFF